MEEYRGKDCSVEGVPPSAGPALPSAQEGCTHERGAACLLSQDLFPAFARASAWREAWGVGVWQEVQVVLVEVRDQEGVEAAPEVAALAEAAPVEVAPSGTAQEAWASCRKAGVAFQVGLASVALRVLEEGPTVGS